MKNLLVVPLALLDVSVIAPGLAVRLAWAVLLFTLASTVVYVCNDIADRHRDRNHPTKRHRPIAAGRISVPVASAIAALLVTLLVAAAVLGPVPAAVCWPVAVYLALNLVYSRRLKHLPLVDVFVVAFGFVLRVVQGYLVVDAPVGPWLLIAVLAVCLLFLLGKRRHEVTVGGAAHRPSLRGYSTQYLDHLAVLCAVLAVVSFFLHLQQRLDGPYLTLALLGSAPFALFALARYLQVLLVDGDGGDPTRLLLHDPALRVNSLLWGALLAGTLAATQLPLILS
ncbi:MAG: prenyltransferase [Actinobacteria bacterium]|nr:MAG: prenyltransferase [Actinomycetota bacterium]